jgi:cholesterol 7-dehydrogenase
MWKALILFSIFPLYLWRNSIPPYTWQLLSILVSIPALTWLFDLLFVPLSYHDELDVKYRKHRRMMGSGLPPPFPNGWFCLCYSNQVATGQVKYVESLGEHFAVYRGESGKINILNAYCPHLGANIAFGGKVKGDCIECPFHAWKFDNKGTCVNIPYNNGQIPSDAKIRSWLADEVSGQILVWYHAEGLEPHYYQDNYKEFVNGQMICHGYSEQTISCHCQEIAENGPDWAHLNVIHDKSVFHDAIGHEWEATWKPCKGDKSYMTEIVVNEALTMLGCKIPFIDVEAQINQIGPGLVNLRFKTPLGQIFVMQTVVPLGDIKEKI